MRRIFPMESLSLFFLYFSFPLGSSWAALFIPPPTWFHPYQKGCSSRCGGWVFFYSLDGSNCSASIHYIKNIYIYVFRGDAALPSRHLSSRIYLSPFWYRTTILLNAGARERTLTCFFLDQWKKNRRKNSSKWLLSYLVTNIKGVSWKYKIRWW